MNIELSSLININEMHLELTLYVLKCCSGNRVNELYNFFNIPISYKLDRYVYISFNNLNIFYKLKVYHKNLAIIIF